MKKTFEDDWFSQDAPKRQTDEHSEIYPTRAAHIAGRRASNSFPLLRQNVLHQ